MRSKKNVTIQRAQKIERGRGDGPNWVLIVGGALLSTLSIRIACRLKQTLEAKGSVKDIRENKNMTKRRVGVCQFHSHLYHLAQDKGDCHHCISGDAHDGVQIKQVSGKPISEESDLSLPLVKISGAESNKNSNGCRMWASFPELLELSHKPLHHSTGSDSPSISESGSDIYTKRDVINKLRQQLKRRDEMVLEMQNQIADMQNSICTQMSQEGQLQSQLDSVNQDLFESQREIQCLKKVITNHCMLKSSSPEKLTSVANWPLEAVNGYPDSLDDLDLQCIGVEKVKGDAERVELLKRELGELREMIDGKDFLLQSYNEQKAELCSTIKGLEQRLESKQQNIF